MKWRVVKPMSVVQDENSLSILEPLRGRSIWLSATSFLILLNCLIALTMLVVNTNRSTSGSSLQLEWGANFGPATTDGEWWRLATAMFLHFGPMHLVMNMLALWDSGRLVERWFGTVRFVALYLASGLAGNLLSLVIQGDRAVSGGASGAIFGIYGALLVFLLSERKRLHAGEFRWMFWGAAAFAIFALAFGFLIPGIDNAAHLGGLLAGMGVGFVLLVPPKNTWPSRQSARWVAGVVLVGMIAFLVASIPKPRYPWSDEQQARGEIREFIGEDMRTNARLRALLSEQGTAASSFEQLAGRIETEVVHSYEQSFEQLSNLHISPDAPSAATLERLRRYAETRRDATQALAESIREKDPKRVRDALDAVRRSSSTLQKAPSGNSTSP
jgi:rhomboid protease GluP